MVLEGICYYLVASFSFVVSYYTYDVAPPYLGFDVYF